MAIRLEIRSESGTSHEPASVKVYENDCLVAEVIAIVELKRGAESGWYHCVTLKQSEDSIHASDQELINKVMSLMTRADLPNLSTLTCRCGDSFSWGGISDDLRPWVKKHIQCYQ